MEKIKILHLTTDSRIGGTEKNIISLVTHLSKNRYENAVVALMPGGEIIERLRGCGIEAECLGMKSKFDLSAIFKLYRIIKERKIDILHTYLFHANILGRIVGKLAKVPVIISSIRVMEKRRHHLWLDRLTNWMVDVETCVCEAVRKYTMEKARIRPEKLVTIPNGIDIGAYNLDVELEDKKRELNIELNYPILGVVGRLHEQKGHIYLLKAMPAVLREYPEAVLLIVGDGPLKSKLERLCLKLQINESVKFLGFRNDIKELIVLMDVFVLPSLWEGMPNVLLEAMALGKPVVATRVGGAEELVEDEVTAKLVSPGDWKALSGAIMALAGDEEIRRRMARAAKREVRKKYPLQNMLSCTEQLYERLLQKRAEGKFDK